MARTPDARPLDPAATEKLDAGPVEPSPEQQPTQPTAAIHEASTETVADRPRGKSGHALRPGDVVDRYVIEAVLGEGGMGTVYAAYDPDLGRRVAVKLHRLGRSENRARARLLREAQALAQLSHPNVITIYDVGTHDGDVFIAMELVEGTDVHQWLQAAPRSVPEVVDVFVDAGRGLLAAHRAELVHRDFKPDNIVIGNDGRVRVIDFGLARAHENDSHRESEDPDSLDEVPRTLDSVRSSDNLLYSPLTRFGAIVGTPAYMSPEQLAGETADERSDQFSFGVALYEALYGKRPFPGKRLDELRPAVLAGRIRETPASAKVPARLRRIVHRTLSVDPADRYPSLEELLAELEAGSQRKLWAIGGVGASVVVGLLAVMMLRAAGPGPCDAGGDELGGAWDEIARAKIARAFRDSGVTYAETTAARVTDALDAYAAEWTTMRTEACRATHVERTQSAALLDLRMACLDRRRGELAALTGALAGPLAPETVEKATQAVMRLPSLAGCADTDTLSVRYPAPQDPALRHQVEALRERLATIEAQVRLGQYSQMVEPAAALHRDALTLGFEPVIAEVAFQLAALRTYTAAPDEAEQLLREVVRLASSAGDDELVADGWIQRIWTLHGQNRIEAGLALRDAAEAAVRRAGDTPRQRAELASAVGALLFAQGKYEEAVAEFERSVPLYEAGRGPEHYETARARYNLATGLRTIGRHAEAATEVERALAISRQALGDDHPDIGTGLYVLGYVQSGQGALEEALASYRASLALREKALGPEHQLTAQTMSSVASLLARLDRAAEAVPYWERSLAIARDKLGADHPDLAFAIHDIGNALLRDGQTSEALARHREGLALREAGLGPEHPRTAQSVYYLLLAHIQAGDETAAADAAVRLLDADERNPLTSDFRPDALLFAAQAAHTREPRRAVAAMRTARELLAAAGRANDVTTADAWLAGTGYGP